MTLQQFEHEANKLAHSGTPFLFVIDFEMQTPELIQLDQVNPSQILFSVNGFSNAPNATISVPPAIEKFPDGVESYREKFVVVSAHLERGDTFLANLTIKTAIRTNCGLGDLFHASRAKYKLYVKERFLVFSPETFIQTRDGVIYAFPMKGTIDASTPDAAGKILADPKEQAEHVTIVDLIRNDLSMVATDVSVERFRYLDEVRTNDKHLLQVSSEIRGSLNDHFKNRPGTLLVTLLPAGSVTGAPKKKTVEIIQHAEKEKRGFYTGVFGIFDGRNIDSGVMIRFIENENGKLFYRSGGGITTQSLSETEYQEAIDKIYVPVS
jgi:para-aminobenzoate synthetase component I